MSLDMSHYFYPTKRGNRQNFHLPVALDDVERDHFATGCPAALAAPSRAKRGFVAFQRIFERLGSPSTQAMQARPADRNAPLPGR